MQLVSETCRGMILSLDLLIKLSGVESESSDEGTAELDVSSLLDQL